MVTSFEPTSLTPGMMTTEMPEVTSPYSIAAAPDSSFIRRALICIRHIATELFVHWHDEKSPPYTALDFLRNRYVEAARRVHPASPRQR